MKQVLELTRLNWVKFDNFFHIKQSEIGLIMLKHIYLDFRDNLSRFIFNHISVLKKKNPSVRWTCCLDHHLSKDQSTSELLGLVQARSGNLEIQ